MIYPNRKKSAVRKYHVVLWNSLNIIDVFYDKSPSNFWPFVCPLFCFVACTQLVHIWQAYQCWHKKQSHTPAHHSSHLCRNIISAQHSIASFPPTHTQTIITISLGTYPHAHAGQCHMGGQLHPEDHLTDSMTAMNTGGRHSPDHQAAIFCMQHQGMSNASCKDHRN